MSEEPVTRAELDKVLALLKALESLSTQLTSMIGALLDTDAELRGEMVAVTEVAIFALCGVANLNKESTIAAAALAQVEKGITVLLGKANVPRKCIDAVREVAERLRQEQAALKKLHGR